MKLKTFRGNTMAETLDQVKRRFGRHAVILYTRTSAAGGLFGIGGKPRVEITAAPDMQDLPPPWQYGTLRERLDPGVRAEGAATLVSPVTPITDSKLSEVVLSEISTLKSLVEDVARETRGAPAGDLPDELYRAYRRLVENAVAADLARQLVDTVRRELSDEQLRDAKATRASLARAMASMLPTAGPIRLNPNETPTLIALVGPTGVGKTTTTAKLAANFCLRGGYKVGLITIDTYRIAAVAQLRTYADIIDVPLEVVTSPNGLKDAVARLSERDVIFIDTAGRSQRDIAKTVELKRFFDVVRPHEVHLVLSGTCREAVLVDTIQRFRDVGVDRVIFTKLDEAVGFGVILACLRKADAQLSYVTNGQDVPDDIRVGEEKAMAELILGEAPPLSARVHPADRG